jgi:hypothetical protein
MRMPVTAIKTAQANALKELGCCNEGERVSQVMNPVAGQFSSAGQCSRMRASPVAIVTRVNPVAPLSIVEFAP